MPITGRISAPAASFPVADNLYRVTVSFTAPNLEAAKRVHSAMKSMAVGIGGAIEGAGLQTRVKNVRLDGRKALKATTRSLRRPASGKVWKNILKNRG